MRSSVVVVSYRPGPWLEPCLASVLDQADEVVLVDNGSPEGDASAVARRLGALVVSSPRNVGFAGGANLGLAVASGDVVGLLNDDAVAGGSWIDSAARILADADVGAVGPKVQLHDAFAQLDLGDRSWFAPGDARPLGTRLTSVTVGDREMLASLVGAIHGLETAAADPPAAWRWSTGGAPVYVPVADEAAAGEIRVNGEPLAASRLCQLVNSAGCYLRHDGYSGDIGADAPDDGQLDVPAERFALSGVALVTTAATLARIGRLAAPFFAYYEDVDWCWRARRAGLAMRYDPSTVIRHHRSATSGGTASPLTRLLAERNRLLCLARNAPLPVAGRQWYRRVAEGPGGGIRRAAFLRLPWAATTRSSFTWRSACSRRQVWERWAGVDVPVRWDIGERGATSEG